MTINMIDNLETFIGVVSFFFSIFFVELLIVRGVNLYHKRESPWDYRVRDSIDGRGTRINIFLWAR